MRTAFCEVNHPFQTAESEVTHRWNPPLQRNNPRPLQRFRNKSRVISVFCVRSNNPYINSVRIKQMPFKMISILA